MQHEKYFCPHCKGEIEPGKILAHSRKKMTKTCVICAKEFIGETKSKYCSPACRAKGFRNNHKKDSKND